MYKSLIRFPAILLAGIFLLLPCANAVQTLENTPPLTLTAPAYILVEANTGAVIFENNADQRRPVASVTKLMTILLLLERIERGEILLEDTVIVSPNAAATPGSTALLDANASYTVHELMLGTIVASGNDSAVALAEHIAGSEQAFVQLMNERANSLGLQNTIYVNCTGLPASGQYTCARDVAAIARAISQFPLYFTYSSQWMAKLTHPSGRVTDLTNTNRLVRFYNNCDGMKTGSTNEAKYCISASAERNNMRLIAVVLGASSSQTRFDEARTMLDYGFATYSRTQVISKDELTGYSLPINRGAADKVPIAAGSGLSMLLRAGQSNKLSIEMQLPESIQAPMDKGTQVGTIQVLLEGRIVAELPAVLSQDVRLPGYLEGFFRIRDHWH